MSMQSKKEGHGKLYRTLTYIFLIFLAIISIVPFYNMIIGCTHDNAALATSFQMIQENICSIIIIGFKIM